MTISNKEINKIKSVIKKSKINISSSADINFVLFSIIDDLLDRISKLEKKLKDMED